MCVCTQVPESQGVCLGSAEDTQHYEVCRTCVEELALYLKPITGGKGTGVCVCVRCCVYASVLVVMRPCMLIRALPVCVWFRFVRQRRSVAFLPVFRY